MEKQDSGNANIPNVLCKVAKPGGPTPAFPGKVAILTQEARAGSLIIKAKCLPFEEFRETKCQWRVTHP